MSDSLKHILAEKYHSKELAHFYIIESNKSDDPSRIIREWINNLLSSITGSDLKMGHSDIEHISTEENIYKVDSDEVMRLLSFVNYAPLKLNYKFLIIHDAQKLSTIFSNKLLKLLEEPPKDCIIILTNPHGSSLLATIRSRAIRLLVEENVEREEFTQIKSQSAKQWFQSHYPEIELNSIFSVINNLKTGKLEQSLFIDAYQKYLINCLTNGRQAQEQLEKLKSFERQSEYNQSISSRFLPLVESLFKT